jgi:hypothetical protein
MKITDLESHLRKLLQEPLPDAALRTALEALAAVESCFGGLTWLWGPALYERNRILFKPLIMGRFATSYIDHKKRWQSVPWKGEAGRSLDAWLVKADALDDVPLVRRLIDWKTSGSTWRGRDQKAFLAELRRRLQTAATPAAKAVELDKMNLWFQLDEATALEVYRAEPTAGKPFILSHLPGSFWTGANKRERWMSLADEAKTNGDSAFARELYRRQVPLKQWRQDVLVLCDEISDPTRLCEELERLHPRGMNRHLAEVFAELIEKRGRDAESYLLAHRREVWTFWGGIGSLTKMIDVCAKHEWWEMWAALVQIAREGRFNDEVLKLVKNTLLPDEVVKQRLLLLAGVSRELNFPGLGLAQVQPLKFEATRALYGRFPDLVRTVFRQHLQISAWDSSSALVELFSQHNEHDLLDFIASRVMTWHLSGHSKTETLRCVEKLAAIYDPLRRAQPADFTRRAANVLGLIPAYGVWWGKGLVSSNKLARLFLERSVKFYLDDEHALADLIEAPNIYAQLIAYRALGLDDPRAPAVAAQHLTLLLGTLLRPIQRATRMAAFQALGNAAAHDRESARRILTRAKEALVLPDMKYPKEALLGVIGRVLHHWPELAQGREKPVIYGLDKIPAKEAAA